MRSNTKQKEEILDVGINTHLKNDLEVILVQEDHSGQSFMMQLVIDRLKRKYEPHVNFLFLELNQFSENYKHIAKIQKSPTVLILQEERLLHLFEGLTSSREVEQSLFS
ncbi:MAG: hypothetical protein AAGG68_15495 [Bacteroidota bacterium]